MPTLVDGFEHKPGNHCGSTAIRDLVGFHGVDISEEMAFGLGAGPCFYYFETGDTPTRFVNARVRALEAEFISLTGIELAYDRFENSEDAWDAARHNIEAGRPCLLLTDLYYLDHYGKSAHFPGHAIVLAGFDDEHALVADTGFEGLVETGLEGLHKARWVDHGYASLAGDLIHARAETLSDPRAATGAAIGRAAELMLEPELGEYEGLPALERFAEEVHAWPETDEDWQWEARFSYQVIERRGTGGGAFRAMYARFLDEAGREDAARLCESAAEAWTALAGAFFAASERDDPDPGTWAEAGRKAKSVRDAEERLWTSLT